MVRRRRVVKDIRQGFSIFTRGDEEAFMLPRCIA
jgi:hypothetical protein